LDSALSRYYGANATSFLKEDSPEFNGWTVVDFKTDREIGNENQYRAQVASYVEAVRIATELPAQGFLLVV
jgi:hypothetical protein